MLIISIEYYIFYFRNHSSNAKRIISEKPPLHSHQVKHSSKKQKNFTPRHTLKGYTSNVTPKHLIKANGWRTHELKTPGSVKLKRSQSAASSFGSKFKLFNHAKQRVKTLNIINLHSYDAVYIVMKKLKWYTILIYLGKKELKNTLYNCLL